MVHLKNEDNINNFIRLRAEQGDVSKMKFQISKNNLDWNIFHPGGKFKQFLGMIFSRMKLDETIQMGTKYYFRRTQ